MGFGGHHVGMVELLVRQDGVTELTYSLKSLEDAGEMFAYLREFFPGATFVIQPLAH